MELHHTKGLAMGTTADIEATFDPGDSPLELTVNNPAYYLTDGEPMGVVAEVIRNDMGDSLGILVYDDSTRQIHRFRATQIVVRPDGSVTVLPSWFRKSRDILRNVDPMEASIPALAKAKRKGIRLTEDQAAQATSTAPGEVQRFIDEAVILRSKLISKLHGIFEKQKASQAQLKDLLSPGLFDRTPVEERKHQIATLQRSVRLNEHTINAMRDFLVSMDTSYLFPKDPRYRALFKMEEFQVVPAAASEAAAEEVAEFETFEEADEFETFEDVEDFPPVEMFEDVVEFEDVPEIADDDLTVSQPSLMEVGAPGWSPPQPEVPMATAPPPLVPPPAPTPMVAAAAPPPPPPGASQTPPPAPMPSMEEFEASAQRKIEGAPAAPETHAKRAGLLGRLRRGKERKGRPAPARAPPAPVEEFAPVEEAAPVEEFSPAEEFETFEDVPEAAPAQPVAPAAPAAPAAPPTPAPPTVEEFRMPPPPSLPPPPTYVPSQADDDFQSVSEFETFEDVPPADEFETFEDVPEAVPATPAYDAAPAPMAEFEPEPAPEAEAEPGGLDAEKDIDAILAMALGKAPAPSSRPTAKPGVREDIGSPMTTLLSKTKYRRP
jgi:hypothetical protein